MKDASGQPATRAQDTSKRGRCATCERPAVACLCGYIQRVETRHRFVVLQHPREARHKLGSAQFLRQALPDVTIRVGVDFTNDCAVAAMIENPARRCVLLYPRDDENAFEPENSCVPLTFLVVDATWSQARSIIKTNAWMRALQYMRLRPAKPSRYAVHRQPFPWGLCTLEAVAEALVITDKNPAARDRLMAPLQAMIGMHLACRETGSSAILDDRHLLEEARYLPRMP